MNLIKIDDKLLELEQEIKQFFLKSDVLYSSNSEVYVIIYEENFNQKVDKIIYIQQKLAEIFNTQITMFVKSRKDALIICFSPNYLEL